MNKALRILFDVLALASIGGAYAIEYFTRTKLGMTRWVNHNQTKWCEAYSLDLLRYVMLAVLVLGVVLVVARFVRNRGKRDALGWMSVVVAVVMVAICCCATLGVLTLSAYYLVVLTLDVGCLLALIAACLSLR